MTAQLDELLLTLQDLKDFKQFNKIAYYQPYPSNGEMRVQRLFHALGATKRERMLRAGNQEGKTWCAAAETAYHLTGLYPDWWEGKRFRHPVKFWMCGESSVAVRDASQTLLMGPPGVDSARGSGFIPRDRIKDWSLSRGVTDALDQIQVMHTTDGMEDGISIGNFKSYEQGRPKFQGTTLDGIWLDEEPPEDIYSECLTRTTATDGIVYVTFTPLLGKTKLLTRFMDEKNDDRAEVVMTIYDAEHISPEQRAKKIAAWPIHEREARSMGVPMMGEGRIFPFSDESVSEIPLTVIPNEWTRLWGFDFGSGGESHPFAAVLTLWDREADVIHIHRTIKSQDPLIVHHVALVKPLAENVKIAWPHDGNRRERGSDDETMTTAMLYRKAGLKMLATHATFPDGGISTEAGVQEMYERLAAGKLKVASTLMQGDWGNEFRSYHRKDGLIVKTNDDLLSATRMVIMAKAKGDTTPLGAALFRGQNVSQQREIADGVDFDVFN